MRAALTLHVGSVCFQVSVTHPTEAAFNLWGKIDSSQRRFITSIWVGFQSLCVHKFLSATHHGMASACSYVNKHVWIRQLSVYRGTRNVGQFPLEEGGEKSGYWYFLKRPRVWTHWERDSNSDGENGRLAKKQLRDMKMCHLDPSGMKYIDRSEQIISSACFQTRV